MQGRKAVTPVLGATMMFIILLASFSVLLWQIQQLDAQQQKANEKNKLELERIAESIEITDVRITDLQKLNCSVLNKGPLTVNLVDLFVLKYNFSIPIWERTYSINYTVNPSMTVRNVGNQVPLLFNSTDTFSVRIVTQRGSSTIAVYVPPPHQQVPVGPLTFTFDYLSFNYTTTSDGAWWYSHSRPAWQMVGGKDKIVWWLRLTNKGSQSIILNASSYLQVTQPLSLTDRTHFMFYILDNSSTSNNPVAYMHSGVPQTIPPNMTDPTTGVTQTVKFGANQTGQSLKLLMFPEPIAENLQTLSKCPSGVRFMYLTYIMLFYKWSGISQNYGVLVPFGAQNVDAFGFSVTPQWTNPVQRQASGSFNVQYAYNFTNYQFSGPVYPSNTLYVNVNMISGPGSMTYDNTGPWSQTVPNKGAHSSQFLEWITISSSTTPGTYVFQVTCQYTEHSSDGYQVTVTLIRAIELVVT